MKLFKRILCVISVVFLLCLPILPAFAAGGSLSLSDHDATVSIAIYESVKILTGFVPGESFADASEKFGCSADMIFADLNGNRISAESPLFTGSIVCVVNGESVADIGVFAVFGDVDGNGKCSSADARLILRHAAALQTLSAVALAAGDCNADGKTNSADARIALRSAAGLEKLENPITPAPDSAEPVAIFAYYTGSDPQAGQKLNLNSVRVVVAYEDAKSTVIESGFTVEPTDLTSDKPGKKTFTVTWHGLTSEMTVNFTERVPTSFYPDSKIPDYTSFAGVSPTEIRHNIGYIVYVYSADRNLTDFVSFEAYMNYMTACGFSLTDKSITSGQIGAVFEKKGEDCAAALIYDFTGRKIYVAIK